MKKTVLTFGLISGVMISVLMDGSVIVFSKSGAGHSMVLGYTMMVASFLLVYFGIRSYRDTVLPGRISFGRALVCGLLITAVTCACYVVTWEIVYFNFLPHFMDGYFAAQVHRVETGGLDPATTATKVAAIRHSQLLYQNPLVNMAYTLIEPLPWEWSSPWCRLHCSDGMSRCRLLLRLYRPLHAPKFETQMGAAPSGLVQSCSTSALAQD